MDGGGITPSQEENESCSSVHKTRGEWFDYFCPIYMSYGMSYDEYWNGDNDLPKYYREKHKIEQSEKNRDAWLQGFYVYEAVSALAPLLNALAKDKKPLPYRDAPVPLTKREFESEQERQRRKHMQKAMESFRELTAEINKKFEKRGEDANG